MSINKTTILSDKQLLIMVVILVIVPIILYYPSLYYHFLPVLDDEWLVTNNDGIKDFSIQGFIHLFFYDTKDLHYMPVTYVSLSIDYLLFGINPVVFKLHNLLLHITSGVLVFIFLNLLVKNRWIAFVVALIFILHPMNIESTTWIACRKQGLFYSYMLASMISYKLYLDNAQKKNSYLLYFVAIIFWIISIMAKTTSITLPGVFLLLYIHKNRDTIKIKSICKQLLPMLPIVILFWYLNKVANDRNFLMRDFSYSYFEHLVLAGYSYSFYWLKGLFPFPLVVFYPAPSEHLPIPLLYFILFITTCVIIGLMIYHFLKKQNTLFFALGFYTITILPMLNLMFYPLGDLPMLVSNRYFYHSCLGIILYIVILLNSAVSNNKIKNLLVLSYVIMLIVLFRIHLPVWENQVKVFENDVKYYPSEDFLYKLALIYDKNGETDKAFACLDKADNLGTDIWINNIFLYYQQRSKLYLKAKKYDRALHDINIAIEKREFKTPYYDSILNTEKKIIEIEMKKNK